MVRCSNRLVDVLEQPYENAMGFACAICMGTVVKSPLRTLVNVYFMHKGVVVKPS